MRKIYISEVDLAVNEGRPICFDIAMKRVYKHIVSRFDATFPSREFEEWYNSDAEKPFKWNSTLYYWSTEGK